MWAGLRGRGPDAFPRCTAGIKSQLVSQSSSEEGGLSVRTSESTPNTSFPRPVIVMRVGPTSHLPPLGTHRPPHARAMIWCPKQMPISFAQVRVTNSFAPRENRTDDLDPGVRPDARYVRHELIYPLDILVCRRLYLCTSVPGLPPLARVVRTHWSR